MFLFYSTWLASDNNTTETIVEDNNTVFLSDCASVDVRNNHPFLLKVVDELQSKISSNAATPVS